MSTSRHLGLVSCALFIACKPSDSPSAESPPVSAVAVYSAPRAAGTAAPAAKAASTCPHTGLWAICNVENRLRQAGFVARRSKGNSPHRPGFSVEPTVYTLGEARLEVFIYPDESSLLRDFATLDTATVAPHGVPSPWETTPLLVRSGNLAAVFLSQNTRQAERLMLALTAGAPQPGSPR